MWEHFQNLQIIFKFERVGILSPLARNGKSAMALGTYKELLIGQRDSSRSAERINYARVREQDDVTRPR